MVTEPEYMVEMQKCLEGLGIRYNEIHFGMYCKPVGSYIDEFISYQQQFEFNEFEDIWYKYKQRGKLLN